jgi:hypothetical protein
MSHFALVVDGEVRDVIVADQEFVDSVLTPQLTEGAYIQTSYNTRHGVHYGPDGFTPSADQSKALRKNFASVGFTYDANLDAFIPPKPWNSWVLNESKCDWEAPVPLPDDDNVYYWDEEQQMWRDAVLNP